MIVGTINVRFYLLDVPYTRRYFRITPSHILGHSGMDASNIKILKKIYIVFKVAPTTFVSCTYGYINIL